QTSDLSGTVSSQVSTQLPLAVRDATKFVNLVPGVTSDFRTTPAGDVQAGAGLLRDTRMNFSINGGQRQQASMVVDGIDVMYAGEFYPQTPLVISPDFTQEMKVHTNTPSAEFGPGSGIVNIVTKSGSNQFHGSLYEFLQNDKLNANDLIANSRN